MNGKAPKLHHLEIDGVAVPVRLRAHKRARRMILRTEGLARDEESGLVVTLPRGVSAKEALGWVATQGPWIRRHLAKLPARVPFEPGAVVPILGVEHVVRAVPEARRGVWTEAGAIFVSGRPEHTARRLADWLKREARTRINDYVREKAAQLGADYGRVAIRDPKSRWGSCAPDGNLNFSWRLFLAPEFVFDYVVSHEVAHLKEHNHSHRFWKLVDGLTTETERARAWLNAFGSGLHRYG
ncbi:MAG: SprT family zinc-dependent metalloprotease [Rhodospirillaceae bacterium]